MDKINETKCPQCDISFSDKNTLEEHLQNEHNHKCESCNSALKSLQSLQEHINNIHLTFKCSECNLHFSTEESLSTHFINAHEVTCHLCMFIKIQHV